MDYFRVFCVFFLIPASQKTSPFQQLSLSGSETTKQGFPGVFGSVFLVFLGMGHGQGVCYPWRVAITSSAKQSPCAASAALEQLRIPRFAWEGCSGMGTSLWCSPPLPGSSHPAKLVKFWGIWGWFFPPWELLEPASAAEEQLSALSASKSFFPSLLSCS